MTPKVHIHLWLPIRVGEELFADMSLISEHALQCLGQSPLYNFLLSQAAGFIIPNPKRVVSSTPGIFQRQSETQPSPRWGVEPFSRQVCSSTGSLPGQMSWSAAADCSCHPWGQPPSAPRIKWTLWFLTSSKWFPWCYLTTKTTMAWLKDWKAEAHVNMHWQILVDAGSGPLPSPRPPTSHFHLLLESHPFSRSCVYMSVYDTIKTEPRQMCNVEIHYALFTCVTISFTN